jgi:hypothetical protein
VHLDDVYLASLHPLAVYLSSVHLNGVYLAAVHLLSTCWFCICWAYTC